MIIPITISKNGEDVVVGTAQVTPKNGDFEVILFLNPGYSITGKVTDEIVKQLKVKARAEAKKREWGLNS